VGEFKAFLKGEWSEIDLLGFEEGFCQILT
jgi:hypothetical protein